MVLDKKVYRCQKVYLISGCNLNKCNRMKNCKSSNFEVVIQLNIILPFLALCLPSMPCLHNRIKATEFSCLRFLSQNPNQSFEVSKTSI